MLETIIQSHGEGKDLVLFKKMKFQHLNKNELSNILRSNFPWNYQSKNEKLKFFNVLNLKDNTSELKEKTKYKNRRTSFS